MVVNIHDELVPVIRPAPYSHLTLGQSNYCACCTCHTHLPWAGAGVCLQLQDSPRFAAVSISPPHRTTAMPVCRCPKPLPPDLPTLVPPSLTLSSPALDSCHLHSVSDGVSHTYAVRCARSSFAHPLPLAHVCRCFCSPLSLRRTPVHCLWCCFAAQAPTLASAGQTFQFCAAPGLTPPTTPARALLDMDGRHGLTPDRFHICKFIPHLSGSISHRTLPACERSAPTRAPPRHHTGCLCSISQRDTRAPTALSARTRLRATHLLQRRLRLPLRTVPHLFLYVGLHPPTLPHTRCCVCRLPARLFCWLVCAHTARTHTTPLPRSYRSWGGGCTHAGLTHRCLRTGHLLPPRFCWVRVGSVPQFLYRVYNLRDYNARVTHKLPTAAHAFYPTHAHTHGLHPASASRPTAALLPSHRGLAVYADLLPYHTFAVRCYHHHAFADAGYYLPPLHLVTRTRVTAPTDRY